MPGEVHLAVQEYAFFGNEHVLENRHHLLAAKDRIAHIKLVALQLSGVAGLPAVDVAHSRSSPSAQRSISPKALLPGEGLIVGIIRISWELSMPV